MCDVELTAMVTTLMVVDVLAMALCAKHTQQNPLLNTGRRRADFTRILRDFVSYELGCKVCTVRFVGTEVM